MATAAMSDAVDEASCSLQDIDRSWLAPELNRRLDNSVIKLTEIGGDLDLAQDALAIVPPLLGADGEQRILVLLTTPAETREIGSFVGGYALLSAKTKALYIVAAEPVSELLRFTSSITDPTPFSNRYLRYDLDRYPRT